MSRRRSSEPSPTTRQEPRLGNVEHLGGPDPALTAAASPGSARLRPRRSVGYWLLWLLIVAAVLVTALVYQDQLRALIPSTTLNQVLSRADQALQAGHLDGNDGHSARELYEAARALAPDNDRALNGLRQVASAELDATRQALAKGQLDAASQSLAVARQLNGGGVVIEQLQRDINARRGGSDQLASWLEQADTALAAGHLDGEGGAGTLYRQVLSLSPDHPAAQHGVDQVAAAMTVQARQAMAAHDLTAAADWVGRLEVLNPNYAELPVLRGELAGQQQAAGEQINIVLAQGAQALRDGRITGDQPDTALSAFKAALQLDPQNPQAQAGLGQVAQALIVQANAAIDVGDGVQAQTLLTQAGQLAPHSADLAAAVARLHGAQKAVAAATAHGRATGADTPAAAAVLTAAQHQQVSRWLTQARQAAAGGRIMLPPGDSAYDLYQQVLAVDAGNGAAMAGLQGLPGLVRQDLDEAIGNGQLGPADDMLATLAQLSPGDASLPPLRERLANAWMDLAAQQLDDGRPDVATQSLQHARRLSPANLRLPGLLGRLHNPG